MSGDGLLPVVILTVQANPSVVLWKEVMVLKSNKMGHRWRFGSFVRPVMAGPKFCQGLFQLRKLNTSKYCSS